jgi:vancomycin permeability regulator SanA
MLEDRLQVAAELFNKGVVASLFVSGDDSSDSYHEVTVMAHWLEAHGVPPDKMVLDTVGRRTLLSMIHARRCGVERALVVTQRFHLPRALWLAKAVGIEAAGVAADCHLYNMFPLMKAQLREVAARVLAVLEVIAIMARRHSLRDSQRH